MSSFVITFVSLLFNALTFAILGRVIMSWIDPQGNMRFTHILHDMTEPVLGPIRNVLPPLGMIDLSPLVALLLLQMLHRFIIGALMNY